MNKLVILFSFLFLSCSPTLSDAQENSPIQEEFKDLIRELSMNARIQSAFKHIVDIDGLTQENHIYFTEIEAPPFKERKRAEALLAKLEELGVDKIWLDDVDNVIALVKGTEGKKTVAIDAHLDTVFPEGTDVKVKIKNDTLFAPGIGDDTRGVAMLVTILSAMKESGIKTKHDVLYIGSVGEEGLGDLRGVKNLFGENGPKIDSWISIDGGQIGRVNNKGLGSHRYEVTFKGPGGHSWGAFGLVNPHHALGTAIHHFTEAADEFTKSGPRTSYNVGIIEGGTSVNSIPFESKMQIDMRSESPEQLKEMDQILFTAISKAVMDQNQRKRLGDELTVDIKKIGDRPSGELSAELPLVQKAMAATAYFGKIPRLTRGSTNSNIPISMGIPAVTIGRGGVGAYGHSLREWWLNKEGYKSIQLALLLLVSEAELAN